MDKLGAYIVELLQVNPLVHLVGIGTFKKERIPARFDQDSNTYLAPTQTIILLAKEYPDSLIINSISKTEGISLAESEDKLLHIAKTISQEIAEKGESLLVGFGKLTKNSKGAFTFIAENQSQSLYKPVKELKLIAGSDQASKATHKVTKPIEGAPELKIEQTTNRWLWPVLLIATLVIAGSIWFLRPFSNHHQDLDDGNGKDASLLTIDTTSSATNDVPFSIDSTSKLLADTLPEKNIGPTYEIIIVSFGKLSEAEKYVADMNAKGYKIRILENQKPGNLYKVSYSSYSTEEDASQALIQVRKELVKDAWILKNNR